MTASEALALEAGDYVLPRGYLEALRVQDVWQSARDPNNVRVRTSKGWHSAALCDRARQGEKATRA